MMRLGPAHAGAEAVARRLDSLSPLPSSCVEALERAVVGCVREARPREDLIREGDRPTTLRMILSGWGCRYKMLEDGRRQIVAFLLPGDTCDFGATYLSAMDHSVGAVTSLVYAELGREQVDRLTGENPPIGRALICETLADASVQREWTANLGARVAFERLAHLLCEVFVRSRALGLADDNSCAFPVTQADLADATGMSAVHVNRTMQELRAAGLIEIGRKSLTVRDWRALQLAALFEPAYLHLRDRNRRGA